VVTAQPPPVISYWVSVRATGALITMRGVTADHGLGHEVFRAAVDLDLEGLGFQRRQAGHQGEHPGAGGRVVGVVVENPEPQAIRHVPAAEVVHARRPQARAVLDGLTPRNLQLVGDPPAVVDQDARRSGRVVGDFPVGRDHGG